MAALASLWNRRSSAVWGGVLGPCRGQGVWSWCPLGSYLLQNLDIASGPVCRRLAQGVLRALASWLCCSPAFLRGSGGPVLGGEQGWLGGSLPCSLICTVLLASDVNL